MANYLMPADGNAATAVGTLRQRDDIISVDNMYRVRIYNKKGSIKFSGFIPPDFGIALASAWSAPFGDTSVLDHAQNLPGKWGQAAGAAKIGGLANGVTSMNKLLTGKLWGGPSYLELNLPIFVDAYSDTRTEVVEPIVQLLSMCAPSEAAGFLVAPGPNPLVSTANAAMDVAGTAANKASGALGGGDIVDKGATPVIEDDEAFTIEIGNFFTMSPAVIESVNANFDNVWEDGTGNPISVDFILQVSSYFAVTREDLKKWLKLSPSSTSGA